MANRLAFILAGAALAGLGVAQAAAQAQSSGAQQSSFRHQAALAKAIADARRTPANVARDRYRNPAATLAFFGVEPDDTVVEIWPGGGWYTEVLAPYLAAGGGKLILATRDGQPGPLARLREAHPDLYGSLPLAAFPTLDGATGGVANGTADVVLTFRNVHNWRMGYQRENRQDYSAEAFQQIYAMLKPGGVLGVVDHRLPENASAERERTSGYIKTSTVRALAEAAGFRLAGSSEVNANPKDTADWANGVWTLPPALRGGSEADRAKYQAIGESDRMTLKFVKPR